MKLITKPANNSIGWIPYIICAINGPPPPIVCPFFKP
jgi:hypothetical protein